MILFGIELVAPLFLFSGLFWVPSAGFFSAFSAGGTDFCNFRVFSQWWHVGLGLSSFVFVACWLTVFTCSKSGISKRLDSHAYSRCVTICLFVPFSKWAWFTDFFSRYSGISAYMNYSKMAWAAIPNAPLASFWSSSGKSAKFWFAGLKTSFWNLFLSIGILRTYYSKLSEFLPDSLGLGCKSFWMCAVHHSPWESESSWCCRLQSAGFEFSGLFVTDLQVDQTFRISCQTRALLWLAILANWKFCECGFKNLQNWCCLPNDEWPTKFGSLRLSQGGSTVEMRFTRRESFLLFAWRRSRGALGEIFLNSWHVWFCLKIEETANRWTLSKVTFRILSTTLLNRGCKFSLFPQSCHSLQEKWWTAIETELCHNHLLNLSFV